MESFGQKMKLALANRGVQLEDVAQATGVELEHLRALERGDYAALPDDARVADCLRSFAAFVEVDGDAVVEDYLHDRQGDAPAPPRERADTVVPAIMRPPRRRRSRAPLTLVAVAALATLTWWWVRPTQRAEPTRAPATVAAAANLRPTTDPVPSRQESEPARDPAPTPARLIVEEHGVGTGVVDRRLVGESERFTEGSQVWFWMRVTGARSGETIRHAWLHEGREVSGVTLALGGSSWRTQSAKTLNPGSVGNWAVEARDDSGRVLARREFLCVPR